MDVGKPVLIATALDRLKFQLEGLDVLVVVVPRGTTPSEKRRRLPGFVLLASLQIPVLAGLEVREAQDHRAGAHGLGHGPDALCQLVNNDLGLTDLDEVEGMLTDEGAPDELFPHEPDAVARQLGVLLGHVRIT